MKFGVQTGKNHSREVCVPDKIEDIVVQTPYLPYLSTSSSFSALVLLFPGFQNLALIRSFYVTVLSMPVRRSREGGSCIEQRPERTRQAEGIGWIKGERKPPSYSNNLRKKHAAAGRTPDDPSDNTNKSDRSVWWK